MLMPGCMVSATTASFCSVEYRRRRATPVITSTFENVSDIGVCLGLSLGPPAIVSGQNRVQFRYRDRLPDTLTGIHHDQVFFWYQVRDDSAAKPGDRGSSRAYPQGR